MPVRDMPVWDAPVRIHPFVRRAFGPCLFGQHAFSAPNIEIPMPPSSHSAQRASHPGFARRMRERLVPMQKRPLARASSFNQIGGRSLSDTFSHSS
ncbi:hypothetical protein X976_5620 [Burkholderia pseudomallei MSHR7500]|nr:hypothetical protein X976_5620 [Burkholderia pseudomallei MSHR7500]